MTLLICLALLSSLSSMVMVGPRVTQVMGEDLTALRLFAKRNARGVSVRAIVLQSSIALFLVVSSAFEVVLTYVGLLLALFALMTVLGVSVMRVKKTSREETFQDVGVPGDPRGFSVAQWVEALLPSDRETTPVPWRYDHRGMRAILLPAVCHQAIHEDRRLTLMKYCMQGGTP
jgi:basic amino acid/polyamine antiporter, APA family